MLFLLLSKSSNYTCRPILSSPWPIVDEKYLNQLDTSRWVTKRAIKLSRFRINFQSWPLIKVQILVDLLVKCTIPDEPAELDEVEPPVQTPYPTESPINAWEVYVDGFSISTRSGVGLVLASQKWVIVEYALSFKFPATNNEAIYEALIIGLWVAKS